MKFELGDKVKIKKHWRQIGLSGQVKSYGIDDLEQHLRSDDMQGDSMWFDKFIKSGIDEVGLIVGERTIKIRYSLWHDWQDAYATGMGTMPEVDKVSQESAEFKKVYLVATRMNCLRRVSFEDIQYIGGD